jgi:hypothetical protein
VIIPTKMMESGKILTAIDGLLVALGNCEMKLGGLLVTKELLLYY